MEANIEQDLIYFTDGTRMKRIADFPAYWITDDGMVWSDKTNDFLNPGYLDGYESVSLRKNGRNHGKYIHRLVAEAFIPNNDPTKDTVDHIDGNKQNNDVSNLRWLNRAENTRLAMKRY